jgi:hypothetical protein
MLLAIMGTLPARPYIPPFSVVFDLLCGVIGARRERVTRLSRH